MNMLYVHKIGGTNEKILFKYSKNFDVVLVAYSGINFLLACK